MSYYDSTIEGSDKFFATNGSIEPRWLVMNALYKTSTTKKLDSYYDISRYRWYFCIVVDSYYRLDYKLLNFDMKIRYECLETFIDKLEKLRLKREEN